MVTADRWLFNVGAARLRESIYPGPAALPQITAGLTLGDAYSGTLDQPVRRRDHMDR
jgi:hypothetical protein